MSGRLRISAFITPWYNKLSLPFGSGQPTLVRRERYIHACGTAWLVVQYKASPRNIHVRHPIPENSFRARSFRAVLYGIALQHLSEKHPQFSDKKKRFYPGTRAGAVASVTRVTSTSSCP